jgi:NADPH:quinone reductase-like Zn-dependent oxidoreductase
MKAVRIHHFGGPDVIALDDVPAPRPAADEVLIRVFAASVNPVDYKIREGKYPPVGPDKLPLVLGRNVCGAIEGFGANAREFASGQEVYAMLPPDHGGYAEYAVAQEAHVALKPRKLDRVQAASVPLAALTAWQGLFDHGGLRTGQRVLIHGGAGGVGHFAVQFAKARGASVVTTVSGRDIDFVRGLGADLAIDYEAQRFEDAAGKVDMVFDLVGGQTQARSWSVLARGGILVSTLGQPKPQEPAQHHLRAAGYTAQPNGAELAEIARLIDGGKVNVVIDATFALADARQAQERQQRGHPRGKIVLHVVA